MEYTPSPQLEKLKSEKEKNEKKIEHDYSCRLPENIIVLFYWTAPKGVFCCPVRRCRAGRRIPTPVTRSLARNDSAALPR